MLILAMCRINSSSCGLWRHVKSKGWLYHGQTISSSHLQDKNHVLYGWLSSISEWDDRILSFLHLDNRGLRCYSADIDHSAGKYWSRRDLNRRKQCHSRSRRDCDCGSRGRCYDDHEDRSGSCGIWSNSWSRVSRACWYNNPSNPVRLLDPRYGLYPEVLEGIRDDQGDSFPEEWRAVILCGGWKRVCWVRDNLCHVLNAEGEWEKEWPSYGTTTIISVANSAPQTFSWHRLRRSNVQGAQKCGCELMKHHGAKQQFFIQLREKYGSERKCLGNPRIL